MTVTASTAKPNFAPKDAKDEEDPFTPTTDASDVAVQDEEDEVVPSSDPIEAMDEQNVDIEAPAPIPEEEGYAEFDEEEEPTEA